MWSNVLGEEVSWAAKTANSAQKRTLTLLRGKKTESAPSPICQETAGADC